MLLGVVKFRFVYECADGHVTVTMLPGVLVGSFTNRIIKWAHQQGELSDELAAVGWVDLLEGRDLTEVADIVARTSEGLAVALKRYTKNELFEMARADKLLLVPVSTAGRRARQRPLRGARALGRRHRPRRRRTGPVPRTVGARDAARPPPAGRAAPPGRAHRRGHVAEPGRAPAVPAEPQPSLARPLEGITVIDFTWVYAGPFATRMLAYYGAKVIRIESQTRPDQVRTSGLSRVLGDDGPEVSHQWHSINADKLSLQINLKVPESRRWCSTSPATPTSS